MILAIWGSTDAILSFKMGIMLLRLLLACWIGHTNEPKAAKISHSPGEFLVLLNLFVKKRKTMIPEVTICFCQRARPLLLS
jgi:hypothetical protein